MSDTEIAQQPEKPHQQKQQDDAYENLSDVIPFDFTADKINNIREQFQLLFPAIDDFISRDNKHMEQIGDRLKQNITNSINIEDEYFREYFARLAQYNYIY